MNEDRGTHPECVESTVKLTRHGNSLTVKVTKEARMLGLDEGDLVKVRLEKL